jgi:hypothetical protein
MMLDPVFAGDRFSSFWELPEFDGGGGLSRTWISMAQEVGRHLAGQPDDTVTFLLGAGASVSSGAPSTPQVIGNLTERFPEEFPNSEISDGMDAISDPQVETAIRPLFKDKDDRSKIEPHVGYLSLAALAKSTRVLIVNLNWDSAVEIAALERIGVNCTSIELDERDKLAAGIAEVEACLEDPSLRIVNLHLHGRLDHSPIRLAPKRTAAFQGDTIKMLWNSFFTHPTVVVGASLKGERDVTGMLTAASQRVDPDTEPKKSPFWIFSRQQERRDTPDDPVAAELLSRSECELNFRGDPFVDFDRVMVEILSERTGRSIGQVLASTKVTKRSGNDLVFPAPELLGKHLLRNGKVLALVGERKIGKSTTARLLAHWESLHFEDGIEICSHRGNGDCRRAVALLAAGERKLAAADVLILDDPFALDEDDANRALAADLRAVVDWTDAPRVIVTASPLAWHEAVTAEPDLDSYVDLVAAKSTDWYGGHDLAALADNPSVDQPAMVTRRVLEGVASTPDRVRSAGRNEHPGFEEEVIEDKLALLRGLDDDMKRFLALVRFYELSRTVVPQVELAKSLPADATTLPRWAAPMLRSTEMIDEEHLLFAHYTDRIAFDRLYQEEQRSLRSSFVDLAYGRRLVQKVCEMWVLISEVRRGELAGMEKLVEGDAEDVQKLLEWGPLLLEEASHSTVAARSKLERVLKLLLEVDDHRDFWALRELAYEVVRLWPELSRSQLARRFIKRTLADADRMGRYCVLEALLYFQAAIHSGVWHRDYPLLALWDRLGAACWDLIEDVDTHGHELALIFDAVAWSRPPLAKKELLEWVAPIVHALMQDESLKGAVALTCLYNPRGQKLFEDLELESPLAGISNLNGGQMEKAAEMIRWHYVHQSRGRALLTRRRLEPADPHLLNRQESEKLVPKAQARAIKGFVERMCHFPAYRGWAIHLAFNLWCTAGEFEDGFLAKLIAQANDDDLGMVTAALTYQIPGAAQDQMQQYFSAQANRERLLTVMLEGCEIDTLTACAAAEVCPPRFMAGRIPQLVHVELGRCGRASWRRSPISTSRSS